MRYLAGTLANPDVFETLVLQVESKYYLCIVVTLRAMLVTLDVSEFHFLFLLIFILFSLACLYILLIINMEYIFFKILNQEL